MSGGKTYLVTLPGASRPTRVVLAFDAERGVWLATVDGVVVQVEILDGPRDGVVHVALDGEPAAFAVDAVGAAGADAAARLLVRLPGEVALAAAGPTRVDEAFAAELRSPITGEVIALPALEGSLMDAGEPLIVLEAMKMETPLAAPRRVRVVALHVRLGDRVRAGALLATLAPVDDEPGDRDSRSDTPLGASLPTSLPADAERST